MPPASVGLSSPVVATGRVGGPRRPASTAVGTPELAELVRRVGAGIVVRTCGGLGTARVPALVTVERADRATHGSMPPAWDGLHHHLPRPVGTTDRPAFTSVSTPELAELVRRGGPGVVVLAGGGLRTARVPAFVTAQ